MTGLDFQIEELELSREDRRDPLNGLGQDTDVVRAILQEGCSRSNRDWDLTGRDMLGRPGLVFDEPEAAGEGRPVANTSTSIWYHLYTLLPTPFFIILKCPLEVLQNTALLQMPVTAEKWDSHVARSEIPSAAPLPL